MINELAASIHFTSTQKGFEAPNLENINQKLLLAVSEICEAQEELRDGYGLTEIYYREWDIVLQRQIEHQGIPPTTDIKPEGFPIELADAIIRLFHIGHAVGIDLEAVIKLKMAYNETRSNKHGRQF